MFCYVGLCCRAGRQKFDGATIAILPGDDLHHSDSAVIYEASVSSSRAPLAPAMIRNVSSAFLNPKLQPAAVIGRLVGF